MALTFKSSGAEERVIIERGKDGSQRVCRAVQTDYNAKMWNLSLEHPSGMRWNGTFHGDGNTVQLAMTQMMMDREDAYRQEMVRGHRPPPEARDTSVRVDDTGRAIAPNVRSFVGK
ncbi:hypothetical protein [Bradyrhizobium guangzhouense]|uniref:hypothetical protein n=1 Tax=Bradyrhizobium guangzhouense TaxID=1325095 RepID=UPI001009A7D3|nr:hypothetical protein [Bradyrhizobium guangzhouense]RXH15225.1 hypothetical protein EAS54_19305 [Bradyrhizobium guangzhouense]